MKKISTSLLLSALLLTAHLAQSQSPKWIVGSSLLDMTGPSPTLAASLTGTGSEPASNAAFDQNGDLLFYVRGSRVFNSSNTLVGTVGPASYVAREIAVVPVPGVCNKFYIIMLSAPPVCMTCNAHLFYAVAQVNGTSVSLTATDVNLGYVGTAGLAVSKLRQDKTRFLFTVGDGIRRFVISSSGIGSPTTLSTTSGTQPAEVELFENPNNGTMKLAYTTYDILTVQPLTNQGTLTGSSYSANIGGLDKVYGFEFASEYSIAFGGQYHNAQFQTQYGLGVFNYSGTPSVSYIANSSDYYQSQIEAAGGKLYTSKAYVVSGTTQGYKLGVINAAALTVTEVSGLLLPSIEMSGRRLLPDQVDNEDYIATNYKVDLIAHDASDDVGLEPNPSSNIWSSPDIWNRRDNVGSPDDNQDPGFQGNGSLGNLMKMRVQNIGCRGSVASKVKLYWTMGATGEHWPSSWNGSDLINGVAAGGELTLSSTYSTYNNGYDVPALTPGASAVIMAKWFPPSPVDFGLDINSHPMICFLGRIDDPAQDPMFDEVSSSSISTGHNIKANNNIVTRNSNLINLPGIFLVVPPRGGVIFVHNHEEQQMTFDLGFHAFTDADLDFKNFGHVTLQLDPKLWDSWIRGGRSAEGLEISNPEAHEVTVTDLGHAVLHNIVMAPEEYLSVQPMFQLNDLTDEKKNFTFVLTQDKTKYREGEEKYGSDCLFNVTVNGVEESDNEGSDDPINRVTAQSMAPVNGLQVEKVQGLVVSPNPATSSITVRYTASEGTALLFRIIDMSGQVVKSVRAGKCMGKGAHQQVISVSDLRSGNYIVELVTQAGTQSARIVVSH